MRVACIYTVERSGSEGKPLPFAMYIPFGIATIATVLEHDGHDVDLLVYSQDGKTTDAELRAYIAEKRPELYCFTAISTQFPFVRRLVRLVREVDPSAFIVMGGHHPSLASEHAIGTSDVDAICVGEGDGAAVELARRLKNGEPVNGIPSLWIRQPDGGIEKNPSPEFDQDLDAIPYINRKMWEPWTKNPNSHPSVLLGRGCPFRCTYCSNHAMQKLTGGRFVRFRSPENIIGEITEIADAYPKVKSIYLEVETIAHQKQAFPLFDALEAFNKNREEKIAFGLNFTVTSTFIRVEEKAREFLEMLDRANVRYLNIGLESGSEKLRKEVLRRPRYTNEEFIRFSRMAKEYGVGMHFYVLIGVPGETVADYKETVRVVREVQPDAISLSIFFPYVGTDLYNVSVEQKLIPGGEMAAELNDKELDVTTERAVAALDLPGFSRRRVRLEFVLFWWRAFHGKWPLSKVLVHMFRGVLDGSPRTWTVYRYLHDRSRVFKAVRGAYRKRIHKMQLRKGYGAEASGHTTNDIKVG